MENFTFQSDMMVQTQVTLPRFFRVGDGLFFKILDDKFYMEVSNHEYMQPSDFLKPSILVKPNRTLGFTKNHPYIEISGIEFNEKFIETNELLIKNLAL